MIFRGGSPVYDDLKEVITILWQSLSPVVKAAVFWKLLGWFVKITSKEDWDVADLKHILVFIRLVK